MKQKLGHYFTQIFHFIEGHYLTQIGQMSHLRIKVSWADASMVPGCAGCSVLRVWRVARLVVGVGLPVEGVILGGVTLFIHEQVGGDLPGAIPRHLLRTLLVRIVATILALDALQKEKQQKGDVT